MSLQSKLIAAAKRAKHAAADRHAARGRGGPWESASAP